MHAQYSQVFRDRAAVDRYERVVYAPDSYATAISARQRAYLRRAVPRAFPRRPVQHDFACGTGRAVRMLRGLVREAHGYDPSPEMLDRARSAVGGAQWHEIPATGPVPEPATVDGPAVVTVLRLLLNVSDEVRHRAIGFAAQVLPAPDAGLLVVENHGNAASLRHLRARRRAGDPWFAEMSDRQVAELLAAHGFTVVERYGCTLFPAGAYRRRWLRPLARLLDDLLCPTGWFTRYATDVLYLARRTPQPEG
jgi:SAM-dependent methyltransferase